MAVYPERNKAGMNDIITRGSSSIYIGIDNRVDMFSCNLNYNKSYHVLIAKKIVFIQQICSVTLREKFLFVFVCANILPFWHVTLDSFMKIKR